MLKTTDIAYMDECIQHGDTSTLIHCVAVAAVSLRLCRRSKHEVNIQDVVRGALLHDYFLYDWHDTPMFTFHGYRHPYIALRNAEEAVTLTDCERDIIKNHMFPLTPFPPRSREGALVCMADKLCGLAETLHMASDSSLYQMSEKIVMQCIHSK